MNIINHIYRGVGFSSYPALQGRFVAYSTTPNLRHQRVMVNESREAVEQQMQAHIDADRDGSL